ncbi:unnamed protein product [Schistocephalus solidus]|uniref:Leucine rich repeat variant n=1 Tax=Schistocephalus solidus TaxID=70667 RepID=A0A183TD38_SCHSO|nr:unnamed protein product [Schistocephalus solidus]
MDDNSLGKLIRELQKLAASQHFAPLPEKLTRAAYFTRWEAQCKIYLLGVDAKAHRGAILALLEDEVYDVAHSADISAALTPRDFGTPLGLAAFPAMDAKALNTRVLEQLVIGVRDPQIRKALLRDRPSTLEKALALAREEEVLHAVFEQPPRSLFGVTAVQSQSSHDATTQTPWQPCSCGSSPRRNN